MSTILPPPRHIALIMDGNGRWATKRGLPRIAGHKEGALALERTARAAAQEGVAFLTVFGFSSENWQRPPAEVAGLMDLLRHYLRTRIEDLHKNAVRLRVMGDMHAFAPDIMDLIKTAEMRTAGNKGLTLTVALNYGGRTDILAAAKTLAQMSVAFTSENLQSYLMTAHLPDPDLLIRTSGEKRLSNFLLWQCAYTELYFTDTLWPDFGEADLKAAIADFMGRTRRFGKITP